MSSQRRFLPLLLPLLLVAVGPVSGQDERPDNPFAFVAPHLLEMPAPDWVAPGVRITWWAGSVTIDGTREAVFVQDPRGDYDDGLGNRYRLERETNPTGGSTANNRAGHGFAQVDVVALTEKHAIVSARVLVMDDVNVPPVLTVVAAAKMDRGTGGSAWANPEGLAGLEGSDELMVLRGPWGQGADRRNAVLLSADKATRFYDQASGILLSERVTAESQKGWVKRNHWYYPAPPRSSGSLLLFQNVRRSRLPTQGGAVPEWVRKVGVLHYAGGTTITMPGSGTITMPCTSTVRRTEVGKDYALYDAHWVQPPYGPNPQSETRYVQAASGAVLGSYFAPPEGLRKLKMGQKLDEDAFAQSVVYVSNLGQAPDGRELITITEEGKRYTVQSTYDLRNGMLLDSRITYPGALQTTTVWLTLQRTE